MILFDFDGVLIDSLNEIALSAYNFAASAKVTRLEQLPAGYLELFRFNKHLLLGPSRLGKLAEWCLEHLDEGQQFLPRETFLAMLPTDREELAAIGDAFFATRQWLVQHERDAWLALNPPFERIWSAVQKLPPESYAILTYKNREAVELICSHQNLNTPQIFSGEKGKTKAEHIREIDQRFGAEQYLFIDDAIENLVALHPVLPGKVTPILADWGYGSFEDREHARAQGIEILGEMEVAQRVMGLQVS